MRGNLWEWPQWGAGAGLGDDQNGLKALLDPRGSSATVGWIDPGSTFSKPNPDPTTELEIVSPINQGQTRRDRWGGSGGKTAGWLTLAPSRSLCLPGGRVPWVLRKAVGGLLVQPIRECPVLWHTMAWVKKRESSQKGWVTRSRSDSLGADC